MSASYQNAAWFYDRLSRVVYGRALIRAQVFLLQFIPPHTKVLIVGGGTGWILEEITRLHPEGLHLTYIEVAPAMMALSKKRDIGTNEVIFITAPVEEGELDNDFNILITPFLFDNFTEANFQRLFHHLKHALKPGGLWLNCDFQRSGHWWHAILLQAMFIFFRLVCQIEANHLPAILAAFANSDCIEIERKEFFGGFILSQVFKKPLLA
jgi:ubiquinone/menaquinone biosynthesis C-methylase UbiE